MTAAELESLPELYEQDETEWLDQMAELIRKRQIDQLDFTNLAEYLAEMAIRDRREVSSRMAVLMAHLLKWTYQPDRRSRAWKTTIEVQRYEFELLMQSRNLRRHAVSATASIYRAAIRQAAGETGLPKGTFPKKCPYSVDDLIKLDQLAE